MKGGNGRTAQHPQNMFEVLLLVVMSQTIVQPRESFDVKNDMGSLDYPSTVPGMIG
jgi:hypothetical protein